MRRVLALLALAAACTPFAPAAEADANDASAPDATAESGPGADGGTDPDVVTAPGDATPANAGADACAILCDDFERGTLIDTTAKWSTNDDGTGHVTLSIDDGVAHSGKASLEAQLTSSKRSASVLEHDFSSTSPTSALTFSMWIRVDGPPKSDGIQMVAVNLESETYEGEAGLSKFIVYATTTGIVLAVQFVADNDALGLSATSFQASSPILWEDIGFQAFAEYDLLVDPTAGTAALALAGTSKTIAMGDDLPHTSIAALRIGVEYADNAAGPFVAWFDDVGVR